MHAIRRQLCDTAGVDRGSPDAAVTEGTTGWDENVQADVNVLNHREIREAVLSGGPGTISKQQIRRIAFHIEQKCSC